MASSTDKWRMKEMSRPGHGPGEEDLRENKSSVMIK